MYDHLHPAVRKQVTICRCNNIKLPTIEKAIEGGASSIDAVAKATTATTGQCGGSCTPKVLDLIGAMAATEETATTDASPEEDPDAWWIRKPVDG